MPAVLEYCPRCGDARIVQTIINGKLVGGAWCPIGHGRCTPADAARAIHSTIRREIVAEFGPHVSLRSGNPLDAFLKNFDRHGLAMIEETVTTALLAAEARGRVAGLEALKLYGRHAGCAAWPGDAPWRQADAEICDCGLAAALRALGETRGKDHESRDG